MVGFEYCCLLFILAIDYGRLFWVFGIVRLVSVAFGFDCLVDVLWCAVGLLFGADLVRLLFILFQFCC